LLRAAACRCFGPAAGGLAQRRVKDGPKPLHARQWTCAACGTIHDRDVNAARNILAVGRADKSNAVEGA
jgi:putative transposase